MRFNIKIVTLIIFCLCGYRSSAQHIKKYNELTHLKINNEEFCYILDSIISHEKHCEYYNDELLFTIHIRNSENKCFLSIESIEDANIAHSLNPFGYFYFKGHLMLVDGENCQELILKTKEVNNFQYIEYDPEFQERNTEEVIHIYTDDSYSQWQYWYSKGQFILEDKATFCQE